MLTQEQLKESLQYIPDTGIFTRLKTYHKTRSGSVAGCLHSSGYCYIRVKGKKYRAHRLAFLYMTGSFPPDDTDHINGVKDDNRWVNLREATHSQNMCNSGKHKDNKSGFKGVVWHKHNKKWYAKIKHMSGNISLGYFESPESAHQAYIEAALRLHGEFANFGEKNESSV